MRDQLDQKIHSTVIINIRSVHIVNVSRNLYYINTTSKFIKSTQSLYISFKTFGKLFQTKHE